MGELPVFTCQAHVFSINPQTKKSWIPASSKAVDVNFFFDTKKQCYRIISVEDGPLGKKVIINSMLTEKMTFKKTSQKFGQWADSKTGGVHGLGFNSEDELTEFVAHFKQFVEASKATLPGPPQISNGRGLDIPPINYISSTQNTLLTASLGPPTVLGTSSSMNSVCSNATLTAPVAILTSSPNNVGQSSITSPLVPMSNGTSSQLQQLRNSQNQVRRLEEDLNITRRIASMAGVPLSPAGVPFAQSEMVSSTGNGPIRSIVHSPTSGVVDGVSRLDLNGSYANNNGDEYHSETNGNGVQNPAKPTNIGSSRSLWNDRGNAEIVRSLYARLGSILQEAVDLHTRLGALLPQGTPGAPPE